jgi:hypothetical protein
MLREADIISYARKISLSKSSEWLTGMELEKIWGADEKMRRSLIPHMIRRGMLTRKGETSNVRYKQTPESVWKLNRPAPTGNGVIDAKAKLLPATPSSLENLIAAATALGSDNGILRDKLTRIKAILEEV